MRFETVCTLTAEWPISFVFDKKEVVETPTDINFEANATDELNVVQKHHLCIAQFSRRIDLNSGSVIWAACIEAHSKIERRPF